jgi:hypothetical protein
MEAMSGGPLSQLYGGPQVADGEDGLQIRIAVKILNLQSRTADKKWSSFLGVVLTTPRHKNKLVTKYHKGTRTWEDSLNKRPKLRKMYMRFGTWNVRSLYRTGSLRTFASK